MTVAIRRVNAPEAAQLVGEIAYTKGDLNRYLLATTYMEAGFIDGKFVAVWGLIPPTMLSEQAYLWVYTTDDLKGHEFTFIRRSQIMVRKMLEEFPVIIGVTDKDQEKSIRWLEWLGAKYGPPQGQWRPFEIRRG